MRLLGELYDRREDVREVLERMDTNGTGFLSRAEMMRGMRGLGVRLDPSELTAVFEHFDANGDGRVSWRELYRRLSEYKWGSVPMGRRSSQRAGSFGTEAAVQEAGCCALVLEMVPAELAAEVTSALRIPTIGIGAGIGCDGQVLVCNDLLGMDMGFSPKFLKRYAELQNPITQAVTTYVDEVRAGTFPTDEHSFHRKNPTKKIARLY